MSVAAPDLNDEIIFLRRWNEGDIDANIAACRDADAIRWMPRIPSPYGEDDAREFFSHAEKGWREGTFYGFAAIDQSSGRLLGSIGVSVSGAIGEIGYFVVAGERRRGIGERALRLVSRWALQELGIARLQLGVMVGNTASARLAEKVGFRREGTLRAWMENRGKRADVIMYSLLPADIDLGSGDS